jgi:probable HAF family extracellular repeat protein
MINVLHAKSVQSANKRVRSVVNRDRGLVAVPDLAGHAGRHRSDAYGVSADGAVVVGWAFATPQGMLVPFAGRLLVGCKTSARWAAIGARLMVFPPTAPWWSAGFQRRRAASCLSLDGVWGHARPRHAGRRLELGLWRFRRRRRGGRLGLQRRRAGRAFRWTAGGGMQDLGTLGGNRSEAYGVSADGSVVVGWAENAAGQWRAFRWTASGGMQNLGTLGAIGAMLMMFPPTAPWWSARLKTPQGVGAPFAGRRRVGCKTSARWAALERGLWCFRRRLRGGRLGSNAARQYRAFRWTASGGMEDLNTTYASLLTNGSVLWGARHLPRWALYCGTGLQRRHKSHRSLPAGYGLHRGNGDVDRQRLCGRRRPVGSAVRLRQTGSNLGRVDVNCDGTVDDADLLQVLFNFGSGC